MPADRPYLLPQPKQLTRAEGSFRIDANTIILISPDSGDSDLFSARTLQREIGARTGLRAPIVKTARPPRTTNAIVLVSTPSAADQLAPDLEWPTSLSDHGAQAYFVRVRPKQIVAGGNEALSVHYAAQTLRLLVRGEGVDLPALDIRDWPSLIYRGVMLDVSRGKVPTLDTLKQVIDQLSQYKMNVLQLYTEHTFAFPHHPRIGQDCGSLTGDDILALDAYAHERQVELQPNLQSFGHCAHILNLPEYEHLAESEARWSLCPTDEGTYALLDDLYADLLPSFRSTTFNVGCDETYDLGKGRSAQAAAEMGIGRLYLQHILRLRDLAARYGRRIQLWGDILLHHPELVPELPDDVTLLDWHYEGADDYPSVRLFGESGREFWVCPGTSSWNTLFPRIENANVNIRTLARIGVEQGAQGLLNTDWGDHGHYQPLGQSWYGYLYGAEQAWSGGQTADSDFEPAFGRLFFGPAGDEVVSAIRALGRLNTLEGMPMRNASRSIYALLDDPLAGEATTMLPAATLDKIAAVCAESEAVFRQHMPSSGAATDLAEMAYSAGLMHYAARKVRTSQTVRGMLARPPADSRARSEALARAIDSIRDLDAELVAFQDTFRSQWCGPSRALCCRPGMAQRTTR